jgi:hypothetical protein
MLKQIIMAAVALLKNEGSTVANYIVFTQQLTRKKNNNIFYV